MNAVSTATAHRLVVFNYYIMPELIPVLDKEDIQRLVAEMAEKLSQDYIGHDLVLIGVLNGSFVFLSDLMRCLSIPVKVDFISASSYGSGAVSSGQIRLTKTPDIDIENKDVLVIEDIVDTGRTLACCIDHLKSFNPKTLKTCAVVDKRERRESAVPLDYACHVTDSGFLVGYGLDYNQNYRELSGIYMLKL